MSRSVKKGPFVEARLLGRIEDMNKRNEKKVVKSWSRASVIFPTFIGHTIAVYNGKKHIPVYVTENMVGHRLGEFSPTRNYRGHGKHTDRSTALKYACRCVSPPQPSTLEPRPARHASHTRRSRASASRSPPPCCSSCRRRPRPTSRASSRARPPTPRTITTCPRRTW